MNRYGLVHTWHIDSLKKKQPTSQASRDDETFAPRNRDQSELRRKTSVRGTCHETSSNASQDSHSSIADVDCPFQNEIVRARKEMQTAKRKMEKTQVDLEEAEIRLQQLELGLIQMTGVQTQISMEYQQEVERLSLETIQLRRELDSACRQVSEKESILTCAQQRKASL